jgi:hypothetical protein
MSANGKERILSEIKPIVESSLLEIAKLKVIWPTLSLPPLKNNNRNNANSFYKSEEAKAKFITELSKYETFLTNLLPNLEEALNTNSTTNPVTVIGRVRRNAGIGKPFDDTGKFKNYAPSVVLESTVNRIFIDLNALVQLYLNIKPISPIEKSIQASIGSSLTYIEYAFPKNQPCLDYMSRLIYDKGFKARKALERAQAEPPVNRTYTSANKKIIEELSLILALDPHPKVNYAYKIFAQHLCGDFEDCERQSKKASEKFTPYNFEQFLEYFNFYANPSFGTEEITSFKDVKEMLTDIYQERLEEIIKPENFGDKKCCKPSGGKGKTGKRKTRKQHRKN